jgi:glycosyltransferase involved in cell wall biosynthesis|uniref:Glycosyltransferase family 1 protein n=1 Tax=Desulfobacca acetoxidans TaxID=60893 RepID=A0A7C5EMU6_9BACT
MEILYFAYVNLDRPNACQAHTLGLLRGFSENGCQVTAVVPRPRMGCPSVPGISFHFLPPHPGGRRGYPAAIFLSLALLGHLCRRQRYLALYARDMDVFVGPRLCSRIFGLPLFLEVDDAPVEGNYPGWLRPLVAANVRADYRRATGLIVPSVPRCQELIRDFGASPEKVHLVLNGAEPPRGLILPKHEAKARLNLASDSFCLGYVGSVNERYDFETMLQALRLLLGRIPGGYLIVVGDGSHLNQVKSRARDLGLGSRVVFTGFLQPEGLSQVVPAMEVGLMNLKAPEARRHGPVHTKMGTYAMFGLPVITAGDSLDGYPEELKEGLFLVPPEDPQALAEVCFALFRQPKKARRRGHLLRDYVRDHLTWGQVARQILALMKAPNQEGVRAMQTKGRTWAKQSHVKP